MSKVKAFLTVLFSAIGVFAAREFYKPRNIKDLLAWRGIKLASESRAWNSMFFENEEELRAMNIENGDGLWAWCVEKFKITNLSDDNFNDAKKFCSDNPKSIMARIIRDGDEHKVIKANDTESFSINYLLAEDTKEVLNLIGVTHDGSTKPQPDKVWKAFSEWCEGQKKVKVNSKEDLDKFALFKKRCYGLGVKKVSDLIRKQGKKPITDGTKYKERWTVEKFEYAQELKKELLKFLEVPGEKEKFIHLVNSSPEMKDKERLGGDNKDDVEKAFGQHGWLLYKKWCDERINKSLLEQGLISFDFKKIIYRCAED